MRHIELTDSELIRFESRVVPHMEMIVESDISEHEKLVAIGHIVEGTLDDLRSTYREFSVVTPSVLPSHDNTTIDRLAAWQRTLRENTTISAAERALALDALEHGELLIQASERMPLPKTEPENDPPEEILPWFAQGGE